MKNPTMFDPNPPAVNNLMRAHLEYIGRQNGSRRPRGMRNRNGLFRPSGGEALACCIIFMRGSTYATTDFFKHCCSLAHVAELYGVSMADLRATLLTAERG